MTRAGLICFTKTGCETAGKLRKILGDLTVSVETVTMEKYASQYKMQPLQESVTEWTGKQFAKVQLLIFIGATGIAVRSIAPWLRGKAQDPAVLVTDESGKYLISLLSGHLGGANGWTALLAKQLGSIPVITTATDLQHAFAVDVFSGKNQLKLLECEIIKVISARILEHQPIGLDCDFPITGEVPEMIVSGDKELPAGICISLSETRQPFLSTLHLIPPIVVLGIGCKKGTTTEKIEELVSAALQETDLSPHAVTAVASIDLKQEEPGLTAFCKAKGWPFLTASAAQLSEIPGQFSASRFVRSVTGVDNVCERSAVWASQMGEVVMRKQAASGVTVAAAVKKKWRVRF